MTAFTTSSFVLHLLDGLETDLAEQIGQRRIVIRDDVTLDCLRMSTLCRLDCWRRNLHRYLSGDYRGRRICGRVHCFRHGRNLFGVLIGPACGEAAVPASSYARLLSQLCPKDGITCALRSELTGSGISFTFC